MIRILKYGEVSNSEIFRRMEPKTDVAAAVSEIIAQVRRDGDEALFRLTERFDKVRLTALEVSAEEIDEAVRAADPELIRVLREAADNIRAFHSCQKRNSFILNDRPGVVMGQKVIPIDRVGIYVPGGTAPLASTVLMDCIPAKIAGCPEVFMTTRPARTELCSAPPAKPGWIASSKSAGPRPSLPWRTERLPSRRWTRSSARATPMWRRPKSRCSGLWPST